MTEQPGIEERGPLARDTVSAPEQTPGQQDATPAIVDVQPAAPVPNPPTPAGPADASQQPADAGQQLAQQAAALQGTPNIDVRALLDQLAAMGVDVSAVTKEQPANAVQQQQEERAADSPHCDNCGSVQLSLHRGDATTPGFEGSTFMRCLTCGNTQKATPEQLGEDQ